jgi:hypothetical protein
MVNEVLLNINAGQDSIRIVMQEIFVHRQQLEGRIKVKIKVKFTLEQTTKARRGSRGISLLFL